MVRNGILAGSCRLRNAERGRLRLLRNRADAGTSRKCSADRGRNREQQAREQSDSANDPHGRIVHPTPQQGQFDNLGRVDAGVGPRWLASDLLAFLPMREIGSGRHAHPTTGNVGKSGMTNMR